MKWTWRRLWTALNQIDGIKYLDDHESAFGSTYRFDAPRHRFVVSSYKSGCEACIHEIFHAFLLGRGVTTSRDLTPIIDRLPAYQADENELQTLAAELVLFERLGLRASCKELVHFAYDNLQTHWKDEGDATRFVQELRKAPEVLAEVDAVMRLIGAFDINQA